MKCLKQKWQLLPPILPRLSVCIQRQPLPVPSDLPLLFTSVLFHDDLCFNRPVFIPSYNDIKFCINSDVVLLHQLYIDFL